MRDGPYFLHEYPKGSSSVHEPCLESLLRTPGVYLVEGPMCAWGMTSKDEHGEGLVKKETCWVTNSEHIARELDQECSNVRSQQVGERLPAVWHRHVHLINQRAHKARIYPPLLVAGILRGARAQLQAQFPGFPTALLDVALEKTMGANRWSRNKAPTARQLRKAVKWLQTDGQKHLEAHPELSQQPPKPPG